MGTGFQFFQGAVFFLKALPRKKIPVFINKFLKKLLTNTINMHIIRTMSVFLAIRNAVKISKYREVFAL